MKSKRNWANQLVFAGLLLVTATAQAAPYELIRTYYGTNKSWLYGWSMAPVGGNILIAEASGPNNSETAYLYDAASGNLVRTISNIGSRSGMTSPNSFVVAAGTNVLIGRPGDANDAGGASLYDTTNGSLSRM